MRRASEAKQADAKPLQRRPQRASTKQMHERLLRALGDRRFKRRSG
ncbi:MAG TPA: hypothetical protein VF066_04025 [Thermoleophilaceae bacterium]